MMNRRNFVISLPLLSLTSARLSWLPEPPARRLRILMLGGTNFVGPHLVRTALDHGHEVTLFNRGITNPHLFPELETLRGDRYPDRDRGLAALDTSRTWDAVIDTWQEAPGCIDRTARMFADRAERYVYISSIATYGRYRDRGMTEDGPLIDASDRIGSFDEFGYAIRKRAGEQAIETRLAERGTVLRCTSISGASLPLSPGATLQAGYWGYRVRKGEPFLVPDDPTAAFQVIDVKDVARFAIRAIENRFGGAYNMVGPKEPLLLRDYVTALHEAAGSRSEIVRVDPAFLLEQGVHPWDDIPNWIPGDDPEPGFYWISNTRSLERGLTYRPLEETLRDGIASSAGYGALEAVPQGMSRDRELELIELWRQ